MPEVIFMQTCKDTPGGGQTCHGVRNRQRFQQFRSCQKPEDKHSHQRPTTPPRKNFIQQSVLMSNKELAPLITVFSIKKRPPQIRAARRKNSMGDKEICPKAR
ncbi:Hypothetical predicted protein [Podarcis lilfordi]|uniref:Uncharacterized protein n=1 Tax=Podarcis lilfordi TaxID=74358 RepID=A0AA35JQV7_9SAUR|nr:Hypothetical predicted protein [Podarcis lilfordi]